MHPRELSISDFTYALPEERIAQQPLTQRDASKLLVWRDGRITDRVFGELNEELPPGALLVMNETRVVNARLVFHRSSGGRIEVLCLSPANGLPMERALDVQGAAEWQCFIGNAKRWREGEKLLLAVGGEELTADRIGAERIRFTWKPEERAFADVLARFGHVPLPPYMKRPDAPADQERYNTVFARNEGSVAAPTASLHFTPEMLERISSNGVDSARLTLHVGAGTFLPVKSERMEGHGMHHEQVRVPLESIKAVAVRLGSGPIVAVGTTAMRTLESIYWHGTALMQGRASELMDVAQWEPYQGSVEHPAADQALQAVLVDMEQRGATELVGRTQLLIAPGYRFRLVEGLVTNFHQPQSTLLLLVAAFIGPEWRRVYEHALANGYRFLSYGDGSLLWRT